MTEADRGPREAERAPERDASEPVLVRCTIEVPEQDAPRIIPELGLAFGCGGAMARRRKGMVEIEAVVEIHQVAEIVEKGVPVQVKERIPIEPIPEAELIRSAEEWFERVRREG